MRIFTNLDQSFSFRNAVITIGSFDGVHLGHQRILERVNNLAREHGGESVVITFDPHPRTVLRPDDQHFKLLTTTPEKISLLERYNIDNVVVTPFTPDFFQLSAQAYVEEFLLKKFNPRFIVIGYDHRFGAGREGNLEFLKKYEAAGHFNLIEIPAQEIDELAISSSRIRKALDAGHLDLVNRLSGHPFVLSGEVEHGNHVGRTIGFPTANLKQDNPFKIRLPNGIYAARVFLDNQQLGKGGMLYIGHRPTVDNAPTPVTEVNILDFDGDLYGKTLSVEVLEYIRPDQRLDGLEALKAQIERDKTAITSILNQQRPTERIAVVILNYNTRRHLEQYLPAVMQHSEGADIIVADNGSPDDSIAFLEKNYPQVRIIDLKQNYGFADGYNRALEQVEADIYVALNSDVEVTPDWMTPILEFMREHPEVGIVQPKILAWGKHDPEIFEYAGASGGWMDALGYPFCRGRIFSHQEPDQGQYDTPQACFWASGAAFFIRAGLYKTFGGFDGDYFAHNEEIDLCWRVKRAGYQVWCMPSSVVYHLGGGTLEYENPRKVFLNFRNSLYSILKNESTGRLLWLIPVRFILDGVAGARFAAKGQFSAVRAIIQAHFSFYSNWSKTLKKRQETNEILRQHRIEKADSTGTYSGSVVAAFYLLQKKRFSDLFKS
ncbi:MAG: riboflavin biosynthesis protein RibF [Saprospiraceae bacterium]|nr:riboflavin biosynthesis protein RibF [Saprospiraceae bacterium]